MKTQSLIITLEGIELDISFTVNPGRRAIRDPGGNFTEPAEEPSLEISGIYLVNPKDDLFDLFSSTLKDVEEKIWEALSSEGQDSPDY